MLLPAITLRPGKYAPPPPPAQTQSCPTASQWSISNGPTRGHMWGLHVPAQLCPPAGVLTCRGLLPAGEASPDRRPGAEGWQTHTTRCVLSSARPSRPAPTPPPSVTCSFGATKMQPNEKACYKSRQLECRTDGKLYYTNANPDPCAGSLTRIACCLHCCLLLIHARPRAKVPLAVGTHASD